jgi:Ca2+-binding EF-hand superfamily protein
MDPSLIPILSLLKRLFEEADDDHSGSIDIREFRIALSRPEILEEMKSLGLNIADVGLLFRQVDVDGSGSATLDEMCAGFVKMKLAMGGLERALAYIQRAFNEADVDQSGLLSREEFLDFFMNANVQRKLHSLGVDASDCEDILLMIDGDGDGDVSLEELMQGFLQIRDASKSGNKAMNYMNNLFKEADKDCSGALSREEMRKAFTDERCIKKLKKLNLKLPEWSSLFDQLDADNSGDVSWEELSQGMQIFWQNSQVLEADALLQKREARVSTMENTSVARTSEMPMNVAMERATLHMADTSELQSLKSPLPPDSSPT